MFAMVETNVQQLVEILVGASLMFMALAGFQNLNGCDCGCGVDCTESMGYPFARWVCPGSIGYACDPTDGSSASLRFEWAAFEERPAATRLSLTV